MTRIDAGTRKSFGQHVTSSPSAAGFCCNSPSACVQLSASGPIHWLVRLGLVDQGHKTDRAPGLGWPISSLPRGLTDLWEKRCPKGKQGRLPSGQDKPKSKEAVGGQQQPSLPGRPTKTRTGKRSPSQKNEKNEKRKTKEERGKKEKKNENGDGDGKSNNNGGLARPPPRSSSINSTHTGQSPMLANWEDRLLVGVLCAPELSLLACSRLVANNTARALQ